MKTRIEGLAALAFVTAVVVAVLLHFASGEYRFSPVQDESAASRAATPPGSIPVDRAVQYLRVTGAAEPGNVEVQALLLNLLQPTDEPFLVFQVALNTHSVSLRDVDVATRAYVENSEGTTIRSGIHWNAEHNQGFHHIMGYLIVPQPDSQESLLGENVQWIKLVLRGIPKIERREFLWEKTDKWG